MSIGEPIANEISPVETDRPDAREVAPLRRDDFDRDVWCLMGLAVDAADITRAVAEVDNAVRNRKQLSFVTPNVNFLIRASKDAAARREILNADLSLIDGAPLVMMAKLLGVPVRSRVAGSDLFDALRRRPGYAGRRVKVFFFGGRDGSAEAAFDALNRENGGVEAVGWFNPGFGDVESMSTDTVIDQINACEPDFVLVALGAAKGQSWIERNRERLTAPVTAHLGAVVDFAAGSVARAPQWMQRVGLEWVWRILEEPSLWRRYFDDGLALFALAARRLAPQFPRAGAITGKVETTLETAPDRTIVKISGQAGVNSLKSIREAFRAAAARGKDVRLDLAAAEAVDRAFLGLVLMLEKHLNRAGAEISLSGARPAVDSLFRANLMNYAQAGEGDLSAQQIPAARRAAG